MTFSIRPIAFVRSTRTEVLDDGWDEERGVIELADDVPDEALVGLEAFSHVDVLFVFDRARDVPPAPFARHPRGNEAWPRVGILAQRAKDRPNRLGLTTCAVLRVGPRTIEVAGLDAIDGTPVVDVKPHVALLAARGEVRQPAWMDELMAGYFDGEPA
jgi:tRNA (adenine37-N6)-methyltransferase